MKTAAEVNAFLRTFEGDLFPTLRVGYILYLTEIQRYSIVEVVQHVRERVNETGATVKTSSLDTKFRRCVKSFLKLKRNNLHRERDQIHLRAFLESPLDIPFIQPSADPPQPRADSCQPPADPPQPPSEPPQPPAATEELALRHRCLRCQATRKRRAVEMQTLHSLHQKLRDCRHQLAETRSKYSVKTVNLFKKRKQQQVARLTATITQQRAQLSALQKTADKSKEISDALSSEVKKLKTQVAELQKHQDKWVCHNKRVRKLQQETRDLSLALEVAEDAGETSETVAVIETKTCKTYSTALRKVVYRCLSRQVPVESVGHIIKYAVTTLTGQPVTRVPSASTAAQMTREMGILSDLQVAEALVTSDSANLAWDATTLDGKHLNQIHLNFPTHSLTLSTQQLPGGRATDYADHIISALQELAKTHASFNGCGVEDVLVAMHGKILSTLTDRAAVNHATVELLQERLNITLLELNCQIHPLDGLANAARALLKAEDKRHGIATKCFGSDCQAANVLHVVSKLRYKANGDPGGFKAFLKSKGERCGLIVRYIGNRLHVLFHLAGVVFRHKDLILEYAEGLCAAQKMSAALRADLKQPHIVMHLQVLGLMGKLLTGPWMSLFYSGMKERNHLAMTPHLKTAIDRLETMKADPLEVLSTRKDAFGKELIDDDTFKALQQPSGDLDLLSATVEKMAASFLDVLNRQLVRYIFGPLAEPTPEMIKKAKAAPVHNIWAERALGMTDAQCRRAPNASQGFIDSKVKAIVNGTLDWLDSMEGERQDAIVKFAIEQAADGRRREKQRQGEMEAEMLKRMKERLQKKETTDRNRLERQVRETMESGATLSSMALEVDSKTMEVAERMTEEKWLLGRKIVHLWNVDGKVVQFNGRCIKEAKKSRAVTVAYWGLNEEEEDSSDQKMKLSQIITDFLLGDLQLVD